MKAPEPVQRMRVGGVNLAVPVLLASGTCGYGEELAGLVDFRRLGGLVAKSVTRAPRGGNPMPRVAECAAGMLNAIGLANVGVEAFCKDKLPRLRGLPCAVLANVAGGHMEEYVALAARLEREPGLDGLELNVSCPNVKEGGLEFGRHPRVLERLVAAVRRATRRPLWVKLSPIVDDIAVTGLAAEAGGADALTVANTLIGMRMDLARRRPVLANGTGGLSGPAVLPVALAMTYRAAGAVAIPVVGCGGIETGRDAAEFMLAGASAVQVGSGTFRHPRTAERVARELTHLAKDLGDGRIASLRGAGRT